MAAEGFSSDESAGDEESSPSIRSIAVPAPPVVEMLITACEYAAAAGLGVWQTYILSGCFGNACTQHNWLLVLLPLIIFSALQLVRKVAISMFLIVKGLDCVDRSGAPPVTMSKRTYIPLTHALDALMLLSLLLFVLFVASWLNSPVTHEASFSWAVFFGYAVFLFALIILLMPYLVYGCVNVCTIFTAMYSSSHNLARIVTRLMQWATLLVLHTHFSVCDSPSTRQKVQDFGETLFLCVHADTFRLVLLEIAVILEIFYNMFNALWVCGYAPMYRHDHTPNTVYIEMPTKFTSVITIDVNHFTSISLFRMVVFVGVALGLPAFFADAPVVWERIVLLAALYVLAGGWFMAALLWIWAAYSNTHRRRRGREHWDIIPRRNLSVIARDLLSYYQDHIVFSCKVRAFMRENGAYQCTESHESIRPSERGENARAQVRMLQEGQSESVQTALVQREEPVQVPDIAEFAEPEAVLTEEEFPSIKPE